MIRTVPMRRSTIPLAVLAIVVSAAPARTAPPTTAIAFAPDGQSVVLGSQAGIRVCRFPDLQAIRDIPTTLTQVRCVAFAPDGRRFVAVGGRPDEEGTIELFEWPSGKRIASWTGHADCVTSVAWQDDRTLASGSLDHRVVVWDVDRATKRMTLEGHSRGVTCVAFVPRSSILISGALDQTLRVWNIETGRLIRSLNNHRRGVLAIAVKPGRDRLPTIATAGHDKTVRWWQPTIGRMVRFARLPAAPLDLCWLSDGSRVVATCTDGHVRVLDPETAAVTSTLPAVPGWAYAVAPHPSRPAVVIGGQGGVTVELLSDHSNADRSDRADKASRRQ